jgi:acyl-CoA reductase-like NAD-dependent aldehyde dehydrogenase
MSTTRAKPHLVNGQWLEVGPQFANRSPADVDDVVDHFGRADTDTVHKAVAAAEASLGGWSATPPARRATVLEAISGEIDTRTHELATILAREEGKTLREAELEVQRAAEIFAYFAGTARSPIGEVYASSREGVSIEMVREPVGVVGVITPWNFPIAIPAWKIAPALAYGNTVVFKPAELTSSCAWHLTDIAVRAGVPDGVLNLVIGSGSVIGQALVDAPSVHAVTFTGSDAVGRRVIASVSARGGRVQCEMGGSNPLVIVDDADLTTAVDIAVEGCFRSSGQRCTASRRLIVTEGIFDQFAQALVQRARALVVGHSLDSATDVGPLASAQQLKTLREQLTAVAHQEQVTVIGGEVVDSSRTGFYIRPAVVLGTTNTDQFNRTEVFGPVASIIRATDYDDALAMANDTQYGLSAGICTTSLSTATDFRTRSLAGMVMVNLPTAGVEAHVGFGGRGASSYGPKEQGPSAREFFTTTKTTYVRA